MHFLPGGYLNGKTVRVSFLGDTKFTFLNENKLQEWFTKLYLDESQIDPKVILDVGTGTGGSAFVLGSMFPQANVLAVITYFLIPICNAISSAASAYNDL